MLGTVQSSSLDKPVAGTIVHVVLVLAACAYAIWGTGGLVVHVALILVAIIYAFLGTAGGLAKTLIVGGTALAVPLASVVYRWSQIRRIVAPVQSLILYELFYAARLAAAVLLVSGRGMGWRPKREDNVLKQSFTEDDKEVRRDAEPRRNA